MEEGGEGSGNPSEPLAFASNGGNQVSLIIFLSVHRRFIINVTIFISILLVSPVASKKVNICSQEVRNLPARLAHDL